MIRRLSPRPAGLLEVERNLIAVDRDVQQVEDAQRVGGLPVIPPGPIGDLLLEYPALYSSIVMGNSGYSGGPAEVGSVLMTMLARSI